MNRFFMHLALLVACGWSSTLVGQVKLAHQFPDGAEVRNVTKVITKQTLNIAGMPIETEATQEVAISSVNGTRGDDGVLVVSHRIDGLKTDLNIAGQQLSFDSANPDAPPPGTALDAIIDLFKAMSKSKWTAKHDSNDHVISVDGRADALQSLPEALRTATERQFDPAYLAQQANDELAVLPKSPVEPGDTWDLTTTIRLEAGQSLTFQTTYQYSGVVEQDGKSFHKITAKTSDVDYEIDAAGGSPLKLVSNNLSVADSEGENLFDNEAGRFVSRSSKVHITGDLTFEAGGNELPATLDLTITTLTEAAKS